MNFSLFPLGFSFRLDETSTGRLRRADGLDERVE
jgi:hypothetical protein